MIGIEDNKPEAIEKLSAVVEEKGFGDKLQVLSIPTKYRQVARRSSSMPLLAWTFPPAACPSMWAVLW